MQSHICLNQQARVQGLIAELISNRLGPDGLHEAEQALATAERILQAAPGNQVALSQVRRENGLVALILQASVGDYQEAPHALANEAVNGG